MAQAKFVHTTPQGSSWQRLKLRFTVRMGHKERLSFSKYLAVLLQSGLAVNEVLDILLDQSKGSLRKIIATLKASVEGGQTLAQGFAHFPHIFSSVFVNLVGAGEASGTLVTNLEHLVDQMEKDHELRQKIKGALMYPIVILTFAIVLCTAIVVFILPNIIDVFKNLDVKLPITTQILLWLAETVRSHGWVLLTGLITGSITFAIVIRLPFAKRIWHPLALRVPLLGPIAKKTNLARLTRLCGTMLKSGVTIDVIIPIAKTVLNNVRYQAVVADMQPLVSQGKTLADIFSLHPGLFPSLFVRMTRVGEESGTLGDTFIYLAKFYEEEINDSTKNLSSLLEPIMLVGIGLMVGGVALSIISPIYAVIGNV